jgi:hypothetical protein
VEAAEDGLGVRGIAADGQGARFDREEEMPLIITVDE